MYPRKNLKAWLDVSTYCNAGCPQCHRTDPNGLDKVDWLPLIQWDLEQFKSAFPEDRLPMFDVIEFCGTWGDPVMNKDLFDICSYIVDNCGAQIVIHTNGSIRDEDWWWNLGVMCGEQLKVTFTVDGINQEMHAKYRQKTDLSKILENLEAINNTKAEVTVLVIIFQHNQDYLEEIREMINNLGVDKIDFLNSNRFDLGQRTDFIDASGKSDSLHQSTLDDKHPLLNHNIPIRDEKWRKRLAANGLEVEKFW